MRLTKENLWVIATGAVAGVAALLLVSFGNPANMGFCIACFLRDTAGALKLHSAEAVQYARPEIAGLILGSFLLALARKEFKPRGGSSPMLRFVLGVLVMVGALVFLGCPLRMVLRLGGGDLNALVGLVGFAAGVGVGVLMLNKGFSLRRSYAQSALEGGAISGVAVGVMLLLTVGSSLLAFSQSGPGASHAPWLLALGCGLTVGALAQRSRFCMAGCIRDSLLFRDFHLLWGSVALLVIVIVGNLILGKFNLGFEGQPIAHTDGLWNFLSMTVVGWGSVLLGGCPLRQLVLAGEGNSDSAVTVMGLTVGAALCHTLGLASSASGTTPAGRAAVVIALILLVVLSVGNLARKGE